MTDRPAPGYTPARGEAKFPDLTLHKLIKVPMRELYKTKPDREIKHAHDHVLNPAQIAEFNQDEEHIVSKTGRFVDQLLDLGDRLAALSGMKSAAPRDAAKNIGISRAELRAEGWSNYPELSRLAKVAPLSMTEQDFLSRCKNIHELWQCIPDGFLRDLLEGAGHTRSETKNLRSRKLLQGLLWNGVQS